MKARLTKRLLKYLVLIGSAVSIVLTAGQAYWKFAREVQAIDQEFEFVRNSYTDSLAENIWTLNDAQIKLQLVGITNLPLISYAAYKDPQGVVKAQDGEFLTDAKRAHFPLVYRVLGQEVTLGELEVAAPMGVIYWSLFASVLQLFVFNLIKTCIVIVLLTYVFQKVLLVRIRKLHQQISQFQQETAPPSSDFALSHAQATGPKSIAHDELDDLTECFMRMREIVKNHLDERRKAYEEIEKANAAKAQFLRIVGHEVRTPLNAVIGLTQLIINKVHQDSPNSIAEELKVIQKSGMHLLNLVNEILEFSRIGSVVESDRPCAVRIEDFLNDTTTLISSLARSNGLEFELSMAKDLPEYLELSAMRLSQILINLVSNAIKFTKEGKIHIEVSYALQDTPKAGSATIGKMAAPQSADMRDSFELLFSVTDTGSGIPKDQQRQVFEPFVQVQSSLERNHSGMGLGLSISREYVHLMQGKIWVDPDYSSGTKVCFTVKTKKVQRLAEEEAEGDFAAAHLHNQGTNIENAPQNVQTQNKVPRHSVENMDIKAQPHTEANLLIVDDDAVNRFVVERILRSLGYQKLKFAESGFEAIEKAKIEHFDVIIMDIQMPGMNGWRATEVIRAGEGPNAATPIIAVTAATWKEDQETCRKVGMNAFVSKPIVAKVLERTIAAALKSYSDQEKLAHAIAPAALQGVPKELAVSVPG